MDPGLMAGLKAALDAQPDNLAVRLHLADMLDQSGESAEARTLLRAVGDTGAPDPGFRRLLVRILRRTGEVAEALIRAETWLATADDPALRLELARCLLERHDREEAVAQYRVAVEADPALIDPLLEDASALVGQESPRSQYHLVGDASDETGETVDDFLEGDSELVTLADVAGLQEVKRQINLRIVAPFQKAEVFEAFGRKAGGGLLLYGPPGCGKTFIARATAGEIGATFINVGIDEVLDKYWGESERILSRIFESARERAPAVLFFDEFDALGASRGRSDSQFFRTLGNQLLQEMDGLKGRLNNVLIMAATNLPWNVDPAFRRPGRFDRVLFVPTPDQTARHQILKTSLLRLPGGGSIDLDRLASRTEGLTGAELVALCERAAERSLEASLLGEAVVPVTADDVEAALKGMERSAVEWCTTARNYARFSNAAGQYDELVEFLKQHKQW